jgi:hypothetical protein
MRRPVRATTEGDGDDVDSDSSVEAGGLKTEKDRQKRAECPPGISVRGNE